MMEVTVEQTTPLDARVEAEMVALSERLSAHQMGAVAPHTQQLRDRAMMRALIAARRADGCSFATCLARLLHPCLAPLATTLDELDCEVNAGEDRLMRHAVVFTASVPQEEAEERRLIVTYAAKTDFCDYDMRGGDGTIMTLVYLLRPLLCHELRAVGEAYVSAPLYALMFARYMLMRAWTQVYALPPAVIVRIYDLAEPCTLRTRSRDRFYASLIAAFRFMRGLDEYNALWYALPKQALTLRAHLSPAKREAFAKRYFGAVSLSLFEQCDAIDEMRPRTLVELLGTEALWDLERIYLDVLGAALATFSRQ